MPKYAHIADLNAKYGDAVILRLADRDKSGAVDQTVLERVWAEVDSRIDSHLATAGYTHIGDTVPAILTTVAVDLAYEALHTGTIGDVAKDRATQARNTLKQIANGKLELGLPKDTASTRTDTVQPLAKKKPTSIMDNI